MLLHPVQKYVKPQNYKQKVKNPAKLSSLTTETFQKFNLKIHTTHTDDVSCSCKAYSAILCMLIQKYVPGCSMQLSSMERCTTQHICVRWKTYTLHTCVIFPTQKMYGETAGITITTSLLLHHTHGKCQISDWPSCPDSKRIRNLHIYSAYSWTQIRLPISGLIQSKDLCFRVVSHVTICKEKQVCKCSQDFTLHCMS